MRFIAKVSSSSLATVTSSVIPEFGNITNMSHSTGNLAIFGDDSVRKNKSWFNWPYVDNKLVESVMHQLAGTTLTNLEIKGRK